MARNLGDLARELSVAQIRTLLAIKARLAEREKLDSQLRDMDQQIAKLARTSTRGAATIVARRRRRTKATRSAKPTAGRATSARSRRAAARVGKPGATARRGRGQGGKSLEQTIVDVIRGHGKPMKFPDIKTRIVRGKLFKTRSTNFDNVLRRTISASRAIKRVSRGVYNA